MYLLHYFLSVRLDSFKYTSKGIIILKFDDVSFVLLNTISESSGPGHQLFRGTQKKGNISLFVLCLFAFTSLNFTHNICVGKVGWVVQYSNCGEFCCEVHCIVCIYLKCTNVFRHNLLFVFVSRRSGWGKSPGRKSVLNKSGDYYFTSYAYLMSYDQVIDN